MLSLNITTIKRTIFLVVISTALILALPALASHDPTPGDTSCPTTWVPQYGVNCFGGTVACGTLGGIPQCVASAPSCRADQVVNCDSCSCACPAGQIECSGACQAPVIVSCPAGTTLNQCTGACTTPYVLISPAVAQSGYFNVTGNGTVGADFWVPSGDFYLGGGSIRAIRADSTEDSGINIGNYSGSAGAGDNFQLRLHSPDAALSELLFDQGSVDRWAVSLRTPSRNLEFWRNNGGWGSAPVLTLNFADGRVGVGTASPGYSLDVQGGQANASGGLCIAGDCRTSWASVGLGGSGASGRAAFFTDASTLSSDAAFLWDNATKRLRIGVSAVAPASPLDVIGDVRFSGTLQTGTVPWARLGSFPAACPAGEYVSAVGGTLTCSAPGAGAGSVTGSGTTDTLAKFTGASSIGDSLISESGTAVTVNGTLKVGAAGPVLTGTATGLSVGGNVSSAGCFGGVIRSITGSTYNGTLATSGGADSGDGYAAANTICGAGRHVCTPDEIFESIKCGAVASVGGLDGQSVWVNNGPPAHSLTLANDCVGRTSASGTVYGTYWIFATPATSPSTPSLASCNVFFPFACCGE